MSLLASTEGSLALGTVEANKLIRLGIVMGVAGGIGERVSELAFGERIWSTELEHGSILELAFGARNWRTELEHGICKLFQIQIRMNCTGVASNIGYLA